MKVVGLTDKGIKRSNNEDFFIIGKNDNLFVVADGMGGYNAGEVAAEIASKTIVETIENRMNDNNFNFVEHIDEVLELANREIMAYVENNPECRGMGTTVVVCYIESGVVYVANVGDSRCYSLKDGEILQLTQDHSLVAELVKIGSISVEEAEMHPDKNIITSALGVDNEFETFKHQFDASKIDYLLICSDGLSNMVSSDEILRIFDENDFEGIAEKLIEQANENGGKDNITVVCVDMQGGLR
jgi:protein phosphatase